MSIARTLSRKINELDSKLTAETNNVVDFTTRYSVSSDTVTLTTLMSADYGVPKTFSVHYDIEMSMGEHFSRYEESLRKSEFLSQYLPPNVRVTLDQIISDLNKKQGNPKAWIDDNEILYFKQYSFISSVPVNKTRLYTQEEAKNIIRTLEKGGVLFGFGTFYDEAITYLEVMYDAQSNPYDDYIHFPKIKASFNKQTLIKLHVSQFDALYNHIMDYITAYETDEPDNYKVEDYQIDFDDDDLR